MTSSEESGSEADGEEKDDPYYVDFKKMENIRVICRFRPINGREMREEKKQELIDSVPDICENGRCVKLKRQFQPKMAPMEFRLDRILSKNTAQHSLYLSVGKPMVEACLEGYNSTIFAYGQTGSGKTYTMFGPEKLKSNEELGCVQRCVSFLYESLFARVESKKITEFKIRLHFVQLYRERLLDLLDVEKGIPLKIRFDCQNNCPYVPNLREMEVASLSEVIKLLNIAQGNRVVDKTLMNAVSSRSHMIMTLCIEQSSPDGTIKRSKLNFADLAGSETFEKALGGGRAGAVDKKKLEELKTINLSLTNLTTCINYLSKGRKPSYRSSQLTFYLMDSLGGNSKTTLIVAASPHIFNRSETIRTMRFAKTAKAVKNKAKINKELTKAQLARLVKKLKRENKALRSELLVCKAELTNHGIDIPENGNAEANNKSKSKSKSKSKKKKKQAHKSRKGGSGGGGGGHASSQSVIVLPTPNVLLKPTESTRQLLTELGMEDNIVEDDEDQSNIDIGDADADADADDEEEEEEEEENANHHRGHKKRNKHKKGSKSSIISHLGIGKLAKLPMISEDNSYKTRDRTTTDSDEKYVMEDADENSENNNGSDSDFTNDEDIDEDGNNNTNSKKKSKRKPKKTKASSKKKPRKTAPKKSAKSSASKNKANNIRNKTKSISSISELQEQSQPLKKNHKKKKVAQASVDESIYNALKAELIALQKELNKLNEQHVDYVQQIEGKDLEMDKLMDELNENRNVSQQSIASIAELEQIQLKLNEKLFVNGNALQKSEDTLDSERKAYFQEKERLQNTTIANKHEIEKLQSNMDSIQLKNQQLLKENRSIKDMMQEQSQNAVQKAQTEKVRKSKQSQRELVGISACKIIAKYFMVVAPQISKISLAQLRDVDSNLESLAMNILGTQKSYELFTQMSLTSSEDIYNDDQNYKLITQTQTLIHYLNACIKKIDTQQTNFNEELNAKLGAKSAVIEQLSLTQQTQKEVVSKSKAKVLDLEAQITKFESQIKKLEEEKNTNTIKASDLNFNDVNDQYEPFQLNDQIAYLSQLGQNIENMDALDLDAKEEESASSSAHPRPYGKSQIASWRQQLAVGSSLDCLDEGCLWWTATCVDSDGNRVKVRYDGFDVRWDEWISRGSTRIAAHLTHATGGKDSKGVAVEIKVVRKKKDKQGNIRKVYRQGWLTKQGGRFKSYKNRFFVLLEDGDMQYFKNMTDMNHLGSFNVRKMTETRKITYPSKKNLFGFEIVTPKRVWRFQAHSDQVVSDWISVIHAISKGIHESVDSNENTTIVYPGFPDKSRQEIDRNHQKRKSMQGNGNTDDLKNGGIINSKANGSGSTKTGTDTNLFQEDGDDEANVDEYFEKNNADTKRNSIVSTQSEAPTLDMYSGTQIDDELTNNIDHEGYLEKAGKWEANWTRRWCSLTRIPACIKCYTKKVGKLTKQIKLCDLTNVIELKNLSALHQKLEVPTAYSFQLVTKNRNYTFACASRHELNIWIRKIRFSAKLQASITPRLAKANSISRLGSSLNKFGIRFGRALGVTPEHVVSRDILRAADVQIETFSAASGVTTTRDDSSIGMNARERRAWNSIKSKTPNLNRRRSMPAALISHSLSNANSLRNGKQKNASRRASAPSLSQWSHSLGNPATNNHPLNEFDLMFQRRRKDNNNNNNNNNNNSGISADLWSSLEVNSKGKKTRNERPLPLSLHSSLKLVSKDSGSRQEQPFTPPASTSGTKLALAFDSVDIKAKSDNDNDNDNDNAEKEEEIQENSDASSDISDM